MVRRLTSGATTGWPTNAGRHPTDGRKGAAVDIPENLVTAGGRNTDTYTQPLVESPYDLAANFLFFCLKIVAGSDIFIRDHHPCWIIGHFETSDFG